MPSAFSHFIFASQVLEQTPAPLKELLYDHLPLYFFGAQGADFCFFYPAKDNLGAHLHRQAIYDTFRVLKVFARKSPSLHAYALGYITHYAMDTTFHPHVYASGGDKPLRHSRIEALLDLHLSTTLPKSQYTSCFRAKLSKKEKELLFLLYVSIALKTDATPPKQAPFFRAISLFNATLPLPNLVFHTFAPSLLTELFDPDLLFDKSLSTALSLFMAFENNTLSKRDFNKNFLTGV